jgi:arsenite methyltransferase
MADASIAQGKPDYGVDAPGVIRNLGLAAGIGLGVWGSSLAHLWSGLIPLGRDAFLDVRGMGLGIGATCAAMAIWMLWSSKIGKISGREALLNRVTWTGSERVLDVGCGRGLLLIGAAKRLTTGNAVGVDIWQSEDLSGNSANATLTNAKLEGVSNRVRIETADMRKLPLEDSSIDVVVSKAAIHNLYKRDERQQAIAEICRVLAPGGHALIDDIRHLDEYAEAFRKGGVTQLERADNPLVSNLLAVITFGSLRPGILHARKS